MSKYITIATFHDSYEFNIIKSKLSANGIESIGYDENVNSLQYSIAVGGIKLKVLESDVSKALDILKESSYNSQLEANVSEYPLVHQLNKTAEKLPLINSFSYPLRGFVLAGFIISVIVIVTFLLLILL